MAAMEQVILSKALLSADAKDREFEAMVREHAGHVYRVAQSVLRNHYDAEDAVQETFLRFLRQQRNWAGIHNPRAWLGKTAWRVALDRRRQPLAVSLEDAAAVVKTLRAAGASAEEVAVHCQLMSTGNGNVAISTNWDYTSLADEQAVNAATQHPVFREVRSSVEAVVPLDKPTVIAEMDDVASTQRYVFEVKVTKISE